MARPGERGEAAEERGEEMWGGEYAVVSVRPSWNALSVLCALLALSTRYWVWYLPIETTHSWQRPMLMPLFSVGLGLAGLAIALVARRYGDRSRAGLFLNAVICGVALLMALAMTAWWLRR